MSNRYGLLQEAWRPLYSLHEEDSPAEFHRLFGYLRHQMSRTELEELSAREINLLIKKIQELELKWIEHPPQIQTGNE